VTWGTSRRSPNRVGRWSLRSAADLLVGVALVGLLAGSLAGGRYSFDALTTYFGGSVPAQLRTLGREGGIYDAVYSDLTPGHVYPDLFETADVLAAGQQPMGLVRAILARQPAYVVPLSSESAWTVNYFDQYASGYGHWEANWFWKLDQVIAAGYAPTPGVAAPVLARRPGTNRASRYAACFGPFTLAGAKWEIRAGGGFWCQHGADEMTLGAALTSTSQLITSRSVTGSGNLVLTLPAGSGANVRVGAVTHTLWGPSAGSRVLAAVATMPIDAHGAVISVVAPTGHGVAVQFSGLRLTS
jgi:hypothetical protein